MKSACTGTVRIKQISANLESPSYVVLLHTSPNTPGYEYFGQNEAGSIETLIRVDNEIYDHDLHCHIEPLMRKSLPCSKICHLAFLVRSKTGLQF